MDAVRVPPDCGSTEVTTGQADRDATGRSIVALTVLYFGLVTYVAAKQGLPHDEIFVFHISLQPGFGAIWNALLRGADNLPPLDYWLRHVSMSLIGATPLGLRFPSLLVVWGTMLALFDLMRRRLGAAYGWAAALLMLLVTGFDMSLMERGYAIQILCFALALGAWDRMATDGPSLRRDAVFTGSLVAAVYAHYYSVLFFAAFFAAACVQAWMRKRFSWRPFVLLGVGAVLCLPLAPLVKAASQYSDNFWARPTGAGVLTFYPTLLTTATPCLVAMALVLGLAAAFSGSNGARDGEPRPTLPADTMVALVAFALSPGVMLAMALTVTGAFHPKYIVAAGVAICLVVVTLIARLSLEPRLRALALVVVPTLCFAVQAGRQTEGLATRRFGEAFADSVAAFQSRQTIPVLIGNDAEFVQLSHYDTTGRLTNCYYAYDVFPESRANPDRAIAGLSTVMPLHAMSFAQMRSNHNEFAVIGGGDTPVVLRAVADGADVALHRDPESGLQYWAIRYGVERPWEPAP